MKRIDLNTSAYDQKFTYAPTYRKTVTVNARNAVPGEQLDTVLADGTIETTSKIAVASDKIITNPGGEQYLIGAEKFTARYEATNTPGVFRAVGLAYAIPNDTGRAVVITAPWGEDQTGGPACWFAAGIGDDGRPTNDRYIIGNAEFAETYEPC